MYFTTSAIDANTTPLFPAMYWRTSYPSRTIATRTSSAALRCCSSWSSHDAVRPITKGARSPL